MIKFFRKYTNSDKKISSSRKKKGFTLIEILVASVVLALLATGLFSVMVSGRYMVARSKLRVGAFEIAKITIEGLRMYIRGDSWNNTSSPLYPTGVWSPQDTGSYPPFRFRFKVENASAVGLPTADFRVVTVEVRWDVSSI